MQQRIAVALVGIGILALGCGPHSTPATPTTAAPVTEAGLTGLLLSTAEIDTAMGATEMSVTREMSDMDDASALVSRPECLPIYGPADARVYVGSGWAAVHSQNLSDPAGNHVALQSVVLFPAPEQAAAFFTASSQSWRACSNDSFMHTMTGGREVWDVGPTSEHNGVLSTDVRIHRDVYDVPADQQRGDLTGQRVLTVRNNVVVDVSAFSATGNDQAGVKIAAQIAAKVPASR